MVLGKAIGKHRGSAVLEFALVLPIFLTLLLFSIKVCVFFYTRQALLFAAQAGARRVAVETTSFDVNAYMTALLNDAGVTLAPQYEWRDSGGVILAADAFTRSTGTLITLTVEHTPSSWVLFWNHGKQAVRVVVRKEGATC